MGHWEKLPLEYYKGEGSCRPFRQKALAFVWDFMSRQKAPSYSEHLGLPRYCGDGGFLCTVGCLVEDKTCLPSIEGLDVVELMKRGKIPSLVLPVDEGFLAGLQLAHDLSWKDSVKARSPWWPLFAAQMEILARDFGLTL